MCFMFLPPPEIFTMTSAVFLAVLATFSFVAGPLGGEGFAALVVPPLRMLRPFDPLTGE
jgi:hypothetical protein